MNYKRKSTVGWSIGNIFLDFIGGFLSVFQMVLNGYNYNDWSSFFGDITKFGLGLFSLSFDIFFMLQHYVFYRYVTIFLTFMRVVVFYFQMFLFLFFLYIVFSNLVESFLFLF